jgi:hypothetical protein
MNIIFAFLCSVFLSLSLSVPVQAEIQAEPPAEIYSLASVDLLASENNAPVLVQYSDFTWVGSFVPGLGQMLLDEPLRGWLFVGGFLLALPVGGAAAAQGYRVLASDYSSSSLQSLVFGVVSGLLLTIAAYACNLVDAYGLNIEKKQGSGTSSTSLGPQGQLTWKITSF